MIQIIPGSRMWIDPENRIGGCLALACPCRSNAFYGVPFWLVHWHCSRRLDAFRTCKYADHENTSSTSVNVAMRVFVCVIQSDKSAAAAARAAACGRLTGVHAVRRHNSGTVSASASPRRPQRGDGRRLPTAAGPAVVQRRGGDGSRAGDGGPTCPRRIIDALRCLQSGVDDAQQTRLHRVSTRRLHEMLHVLSAS